MENFFGFIHSNISLIATSAITSAALTVAINLYKKQTDVPAEPVLVSTVLNCEDTYKSNHLALTALASASMSFAESEAKNFPLGKALVSDGFQPRNEDHNAMLSNVLSTYIATMGTELLIKENCQAMGGEG